MAGWLAAVPEGTADDSAGSCPPCGIYRDPPCSVYRDLIRKVEVSGVQRELTFFSHSQSGHSGSRSSYSSASNSYPSNNSGSSSRSASDVAQDLTTIARLMVSETQRMVQAFEHGGGSGGAMKNWFVDLDVDWVLQTCDKHGSQCQLWLQDKLASSLQDMVERWIRGLTVISISITELVFTRHAMATERFGKASISKMLVFVDAMTTIPASKEEKLRAVLDMYVCVSNASYMFRPSEMHTEVRGIFDTIYGLLETQVGRLREAISSTMEEVRVLVEGDDGLWATEIKLGGGEVHRNTRLIVHSIVSMKNAVTLTGACVPRDSELHIDALIDKTMDYLKHMLLRKSELCLDPSLRYLFLVNNSYFIRSLDHSVWYQHCTIEYTSEYKGYMDSYLDVSWGPVLSCIPKSHFTGPLHRWINTSSLAKFESAFQKTYQAQKFWKVPHPRIRSELRKVITARVISGYRHYLKEHPELEKHVGCKSSSPEVLEEMLGELFEG